MLHKHTRVVSLHDGLGGGDNHSCVMSAILHIMAQFACPFRHLFVAAVQFGKKQDAASICRAPSCHMAATTVPLDCGSAGVT